MALPVGFGLRERVLAGLGVQMERAVVGDDGSVRLDGGNRDLGLRTVGERQMGRSRRPSRT